MKALVEGAVERQLSFLSLLGSGAGEGAAMMLAVEVGQMEMEVADDHTINWRDTCAFTPVQVRSEELAVAGASEAYTLAVRLEAGQLRVEVSADTYFGAR